MFNYVGIMGYSVEGNETIETYYKRGLENISSLITKD